jgi:hypothetical protein
MKPGLVKVATPVMEIEQNLVPAASKLAG